MLVCHFSTAESAIRRKWGESILFFQMSQFPCLSPTPWYPTVFVFLHSNEAACKDGHDGGALAAMPSNDGDAYSRGLPHQAAHKGTNPNHPLPAPYPTLFPTLHPLPHPPPSPYAPSTLSLRTIYPPPTPPSTRPLPHPLPHPPPLPTPPYPPPTPPATPPSTPTSIQPSTQPSTPSLNKIMTGP